MRVSGILGLGAALGLVVCTVVCGKTGAFYVSAAGVVFCLGLTLAIGIASFGVGDVLHAVAALRALVVALKPGAVSGRDVEVMRGLVTPLYAAGMIGTLIGMVQMLATLEDPSQLGAGTGVALLTILYSAVGAELLLRPASRLAADLSEAAAGGAEEEHQ